MATNMYHGALKALSPVWATIKTAPMVSKYPAKDGSPKSFCILEIAGAEHSYTVENANCGAALAPYHGQTVELQAAGTREDATIDILQVQQAGDTAPQAAPVARPAAPAPRAATPAARPPVAAPRPVAAARPVAPPQQTAPPQPQRKQPEQAIADTEAFLQKRRLLLNLCARQAAQAVMQFQQEMQPHVDAGAFAVDAMGLMQSWTASLFITADRSGQADALPTDAENDQPPM